MTLQADLNLCTPHYMGELDSNLSKTRADMSKRTKKIQKAVKEMTVTAKIIALSAASPMTQSETTTAKASTNQMSAQIETQIAKSAVALAVRTSVVEKIAATTRQSKAKNQPQKRNLSLS